MPPAISGEAPVGSPSVDAEATCTALIVGAGPAGLAAANMLVCRGYKGIRVVDRVRDPTHVNPHRAYTYLLSPAGKAALRELGMDDIDDTGLTTLRMPPFTVCKPDGSVTERKMPFSRAGSTKATVGTFLSRPDLLSYLHTKTQELCGDAVTVEYGCKVVQVEVSPDGSTVGAESAPLPSVTVEAPDGARTRWRCQLLIAGDGANSAVRKALDRVHPGGAYQMQSFPCKSGGLHFKGLPLPPQPTVMSSAGPVPDNIGHFVIGRAAFPGAKPLSLGIFPSGNPTEPRPATIVQYSDHPIWQVSTAEELYSALKASFPQFDALRTTVTPEAAQAFVDEKPGVFPLPQHCARLVAAYRGGQEGGESKQFAGSGVVLLGDAAHVFPPDLGQGVNSALLDVKWLGRQIDAHPDDLPAALKAFEAKQLPEHRALINLQQDTAPYQYMCVGGKLERALYYARVMVDRLSYQAMPFFFEAPTSMQISGSLTGPEISYVAAKKARETKRNKLLAMVAAILAAGVALLFR